MNNTTKKVIILNKLPSPYISEAIIILKDGFNLPHSSIVTEAEHIVRSYLERSEKNGRAPKRAARLCRIKTAVILCALSALCAFFLCYSLFNN